MLGMKIICRSALCPRDEGRVLSGRTQGCRQSSVIEQITQVVVPGGPLPLVTTGYGVIPLIITGQPSLYWWVKNPQTQEARGGCLNC